MEHMQVMLYPRDAVTYVRVYVSVPTSTGHRQSVGTSCHTRQPRVLGDIKPYLLMKQGVGHSQYEALYI